MPPALTTKVAVSQPDAKFEQDRRMTSTRRFNRGGLPLVFVPFQLTVEICRSGIEPLPLTALERAYSCIGQPPALHRRRILHHRCVQTTREI